MDVSSPLWLAVLLTPAPTLQRTRGGQGPEPGKGERSAELRMFLEMNAEEQFDLETLNSIDLRALGRAVLREKRFSREVMRTVDALLPRVRSETEDPALAGAILRSKTLDWYRHSPANPDWTEKMALRWGGIFHESRVPGGRLSVKLSARLVRLRMECARASGFVGLLLRLGSGLKSVRNLIRVKSIRNLMVSVKAFRTESKRPSEPPMPQVSQAYLDDLAANARPGDRPFGLERLSGLARQIGLPEVNRTLGELFPRAGAGPAIVLDARFHSDVHDVMVRVQAKAAADAVTYELVHGEAAIPRESAGSDNAGASLGLPWERLTTKDDWRPVLEAVQKRKARLDPPPIENYRSLESYLGLRELILADPSACTAFLAVHWKGRPSGLALLAQLLADGSFLPDAETDGDYLEAELGDIEKGDPDSRPKDGRWHLGDGRTVVREIAEGSVRTYRAERATLDSRKAAARTS
jgi:hypothetical protein